MTRGSIPSQKSNAARPITLTHVCGLIIEGMAWWTTWRASSRGLDFQDHG